MAPILPLDLPVSDALPALRAALASSSSAVLRAPPGAGKTTLVPLALVHEPWLAGRRMVMLEPRRLAARAAARRMAVLLGERVGETVGYRMRMETVVGPRTRIEVVTEGVLTRMLQRDPTLDGIGLLIFDEFHERSLAADVGLSLSLYARSTLRDDLRILVMSATLDDERVARLLDPHGAPVITSEGRAYPVETRYLPRRPEDRIERAVTSAIRRALAGDEGDILAFLPGAAEIRRSADALEDALRADPPPGAAVRVLPLFGALDAAAQDAAIDRAPAGTRKVVLATSIAETSLTIEGIRIVVDAGHARVPRWSPRTGMTRLETVRVTRASADQRRGRAGRTAPGVCYRLWAEHEQTHLLPFAAPEIMDADLAPLTLDLAAAGVADAAELPWLDPPPPAALAGARELLEQLGALDARGRLTSRGERMASLAMHPRLAHMLLEADALGLGGLACDLAALLGERDILRGHAPDADLRLRVAMLREGGSVPGGAEVDRDALRRARAEARHWRGRLRALHGHDDVDATGLVLAFAYPDRIAQRRAGAGAAGARYLLRGGGGAHFTEAQPLARDEYIVAAELDGRRPESRIFLAAPIALAEIELHFADQIEREASVIWDAGARAVIARERVRLGALVLREGPLRAPDPDLVRVALLEGLTRAGVAALPWSDAARALRQRVAFLRRLDPAWPDLSDDALAESLGDEWLGPRLDGVRRPEELRRLDLAAMLLERLPRDRRAALESLAPTHVAVPSGSRVPIDYSDPGAPALAVRLQEMFGLADTPRIAGGRVPLTLHLLSPAHRPVQVTRDLAGFWRGAYFDVRKDLRGRYPKHHWPDDPLAAVATSRAKRRG
jgi:ATP-dependent helicase HrpB